MNPYYHNDNRKVICVDFDDILTIYSGDFEPLPRAEAIKTVQRLYTHGHIIIIWTARRWSEATSLIGWLIKHDVPFHGVHMQKGGADYYVDDKAWKNFNLLEEELRGEGQ